MTTTPYYIDLIGFFNRNACRIVQDYTLQHVKIKFYNI